MEMEIVEDSLEGEIVEDSLDGVDALIEIDLNKSDDEAQSKNLKDPGAGATNIGSKKDEVAEFDLNKFPIDDGEDVGPEEKQPKEVVRNMLKIYLPRFH
ncbi:hypothetical protein SESBI_14171 [Sesbania bispinosa]|nr:hypothetical protein SESBI_14171 [Sesbania bispinosa]